MNDHWQVYALKYADRNARVRGESFLFDDHPAAPHGIDYFIWVLVSGDRHIVVDTGYEAEEAARRDRPILRDPAVALQAAGVDAERVEDVVITHLHYDHAGGLSRFPKARFHLQAAEMAYATGPCMCHPLLQVPFTAQHVCEMVRHVYSGRVAFYEGAAEIAPGVRIHRTGGHSRGLQVVEVATADGPLCLASDAAHYYENFERGMPYPIVVDVEETLNGYATIRRLAGGDDARVIPGHDPLVTERFPAVGTSGFLWRLDKGPLAAG